MIFIGDLYKLPPVITPKEKESLREFYKTPYFLMLKFFKKSENLTKFIVKVMLSLLKFLMQ